MVAEGVLPMVSRQGRELQRYSSTGGRIVVGCVPYRINGNISCLEDVEKAVQVLVISSQKGHGMMFPKGGWETDETMKQAATREALEEAGLQGKLGRKLGKWSYKSKSHGIFYDGILFPLKVTNELLRWPEMQARKRTWVSVNEAREGCQHEWMREALEKLIKRLQLSSNKN